MSAPGLYTSRHRYLYLHTLVCTHHTHNTYAHIHKNKIEESNSRKSVTKWKSEIKKERG